MSSLYNAVRAVLTTAMLITVVSTPTHPCTCFSPEPGFLAEPGAVLPSNAVGIPWVGKLCTEDPLRNTNAFVIERISDGAAVSVPPRLSYSEVPHALIGALPERLLMLSPEGGLVPGARYIFRYAPLPGSRKCGSFRNEEVHVSVAVNTLFPFVNAPPAFLNVGDVVRRTTTIGSRAGMCSDSVDAVERAVSLVLPRDLFVLQGAILFSTFVNGEPWKPSRMLCDSTAPGSSWEGRGRDRILVACNPAQPNTYIEVMPPGTQVVEMHAWLAGTENLLSASAVFELRCESKPANSSINPAAGGTPAAETPRQALARRGLCVR